MILLSCRSSLTRELSCPMAGVSSVNSLCDKFSSVKVCLVNIELNLKGIMIILLFVLLLLIF